MFESLTEKLAGVFSSLRQKGHLTEADVKAGLRQIRLVLLEADVNYKVVKDFIKSLEAEAVGEQVLKSLSPDQQLVKLVRDKLVELLGESRAKLDLGTTRPAALMLVGLQGSGKTTTAAKLARYLAGEDKQSLLVAADVYRPAAIQQLEKVGAQAQVEVFQLGTSVDPVDIAAAGLAHARRKGLDVVLVDTAGRLQVDEELMSELERMKQALKPAEILLVVDSQTGQEAVNVAKTFDERLGLTGLILTKLDGDARGGAALSVRAVTGKPIKFVGVGEKLDGLEPFYPDRMASRILGMGDVLSLIEKAEKQVDEEAAKEMTERMLRAEFNFEDFLKQMKQLRNMGPLDHLLEMVPGFNNLKRKLDVQVDEKDLKRIEAMIQSMTLEERRNPEIINSSRRKRIARGSGRTVHDVNLLLKQFRQMKKMMKQMGAAARRGRPPLGFGGF